MSENNTRQSEQELEHVSYAGNPGGFLAGLLLGSLAGAGAMLMLAPHSGKRTRANIQHKSMELRDQATETVEDAVAQARAKAHQIGKDVRKEADSLQQRGQDALVDQMQRVSDVVEAGKSAVHGS